MVYIDFFFSSRRRHTRYWRDWSSDVCSSDLEALKDSVKLEINQKFANGVKEPVLIFGNMGEDMCKELNIDSNKLVTMSNCVGFTLECCENLGIKKITMVGHIGKMCKKIGRAHV